MIRVAVVGAGPAGFSIRSVSSNASFTTTQPPFEISPSFRFTLTSASAASGCTSRV